MKKVEYQIWLQGSDGKNYVISYEGLKRMLGLCKLQNDIREMRYTINQLRDKVIEKLIVPEMEEQILAIIKDNPNIETHSIILKIPHNLWVRLAWYQAFDKLKEQGRIIGTSHGRGRNRTWKLREEEKHQ